MMIVVKIFGMILFVFGATLLILLVAWAIRKRVDATRRITTKDVILSILAALVAAAVIWATKRVVAPQREPEVAKSAVCDTLSDWQMLEMAIIFTESRGKPYAVGKGGDWGVMQIRDIYVQEANRRAGTDYVHEDAFDIRKSLEMFNIVNPEQDIEKALKRHNPGSKGYAYRQNYEMIKRMEKVRWTIKNMDE